MLYRRDACSSSMSILSLLFCLQVHQSLYSPMLEHMFTRMLYGFRHDALFFLYVYPLSSVLSAGPPVPEISNARTHVHNNALWLQAWCLFFLYVYPLSSVLSVSPPVPVISMAGTQVHNNALWLQAWCLFFLYVYPLYSVLSAVHQFL